MSFYTFTQNNSGGHFDFCEDDGVTHHVIIEADSSHEANEKMLELVGDFEGGKGGYCPCCGERWYECDDSDATESPMYSGTDLLEDEFNFMRWMKVGKEVCIHFTNGEKVWL